MISGYIEYKDRANAVAEFTLDFGSQNVLVFVWRDVRGLRRNTAFEGDYVGAYVAYPMRKKRSGLFGEIHLVQGRIGAGYVAHEIQHFVYDWQWTQPQSRNLNERCALLAGNVTRQFWKRWYARRK